MTSLEEVSGRALRALLTLPEGAEVTVQVAPSQESGCTSITISGGDTLVTFPAPCPVGMSLEEWVELVTTHLSNNLPLLPSDHVLTGGRH